MCEKKLILKGNKVISESKTNVDGCPSCDNNMGFSFGRCVSCGFNYISAEYEVIRVNINHLPKEIRNNLINLHAGIYGVEVVDLSYNGGDYYE